ncbi:MAG: hypothetical protein QXW44_07310, partial [Pyrobaculum sp.]
MLPILEKPTSKSYKIVETERPCGSAFLKVKILTTQKAAFTQDAKSLVHKYPPLACTRIDSPQL